MAIITKSAFEALLNESTSMTAAAEAELDTLLALADDLQNSIDAIAPLVWGIGMVTRASIKTQLVDVTTYEG